MSIAFVFAGQGVQKVGMVNDLQENNIFNEVYNKLSTELRNLISNGPQEELNKTINSQPAIFAISLGISKVLKSYGIDCEFACGLSLGEYTALAYSNVLDVDNAIEIVKERGQIMSNAFEGLDTGMLAVINSDLDIINKIIKKIGNLEIANYNSPKQIVLTGDLNSINKASEEFRTLKIRSIKLNVSGAFHSSYLKEASENLYKLLEKYEFNQTDKRIVFNVEGKESDKNIKELLKNQIKSSVKFLQGIEYMIEKGVNTFIEIGPGKVLSSFIKQINSEVSVYQVDSIESIEKVRDLLNE